MARPDNLESTPFTRQGESAGGHIRALPNLGARGSEIGKVRLNGHLDSAVSPEELKDYLLDPNIYGPRSRRSFFANPSRNYRPSGNFN